MVGNFVRMVYTFGVNFDGTVKLRYKNQNEKLIILINITYIFAPLNEYSDIKISLQIPDSLWDCHISIFKCPRFSQSVNCFLIDFSLIVVDLIECSC